TYKRNAFNNGFGVLECPPLVDWLAAEFLGDSRPTVRTGHDAVIDFRSSRVTVGDRAFDFVPLGEVAQRLIVAGGAENLVRETLA
ncbi:MAG: homoaconitase, partial [Gemmatimonadetes bacterium]|nr:homoaconitase [Gemmatimonadota bacterium]